MLQFLQMALAADIGIIVRSLDGRVEALRAQLYRARKESGDPAYLALSIISSPLEPTDLWIIKRVYNDSPQTS